MVPVMTLWLPIVVSAVFVFVASFLLHMVLPFHRSDYRTLSEEDAVMAALRKFNIPPGDYMVPCPRTPKEMGTPQFIAKMTKGPAFSMTVRPSGPPTMAGSLIQWFIYCLIVGVFAAYIGGRALGPGSNYLAVFRFVGCTAFLAYGMALWQDTIWYKRNPMTTLRYTIDSLVFALLTAGTFGWLWPR